MDYFNFVLLLPAFWALLSMFCLWVWSQHRQHHYLCVLAAAWLCAGLTQGNALFTHIASLGGQWAVVVTAWLGAAALAQATAMRFGRSVQPSVLAGISALMLLGWALAPSSALQSQLLTVGLALILAHILPVVWRLVVRHRMERVLLISYSTVCALVLQAALLGLVPVGGWLGSSWVLPGCALALTAAMVGCVWAESPAHWHAQRDRDGLTGLLNRLAFEKASGARPAERHISFVVLCDIDHFQRIKQQQGAAAADQMLCHFAQVLKHSVRTGDLVARLGGEEFALALRHIDQANAQALVQRIIHTIGQQSMGPWTASFGLAEVRENEHLDMALHRADVLLCQAKDAGCNRVAVEEPAAPAARHAYLYSH